MSASNHTCPTCGRRPSERRGPGSWRCCPDPIHDLADRCEELLGIGKHQILRAEEAEAERDALLEALEDIASFKGKTLIRDGRYDEGANAAFEECAGLARAALPSVQDRQEGSTP